MLTCNKQLKLCLANLCGTYKDTAVLSFISSKDGMDPQGHLALVDVFPQELCPPLVLKTLLIHVVLRIPVLVKQY